MILCCKIIYSALLNNLTQSHTEDRCVAVLKSQASKAACPLDLLAPEILGKKLLQLLTVSTQASKKEQLLKASQLVKNNRIF